eukprot:TRINITY_DN10840_c0_g1_i1.p1 TRINITY_DN10840_c0_g1~~TRINITY_DN10840_c0_g1_i1.p1  ORF type:complete len:473 (+),score=133.09 TRINITY_DN10840_c0_g1_i1:84-1421(+)
MISSPANGAQNGAFPSNYDDEATIRAVAEQRRHSMTGMNPAYSAAQFPPGARTFRQFGNQAFVNGMAQSPVDQQSVQNASLPYQPSPQQMMNAGIYPPQPADISSAASPSGGYPPQVAADAYSVVHQQQQQQQQQQAGRAAVAPTDPRWAEARKSCEAIYVSLSKLSTIGSVSRENFNALKTMALSLASTIDNLDPDKSAGGMIPRGSMDLMAQSSMGGYPPFQGAGPFAGAVNPWAAGLGMMPFVDPIRAAYQQGVMAAAAVAAAQQQQQQVAPVAQPEKKRRRTSSASQRNLFCHMCNATETPEWRRGPDGEHTLCNACGLYYAKMISKQRKEREGRKHSIEILLNPGGRGAAGAGASGGADAAPGDESGAASGEGAEDAGPPPPLDQAASGESSSVATPAAPSAPANATDNDADQSGSDESSPEVPRANGGASSEPDKSPSE